LKGHRSKALKKVHKNVRNILIKQTYFVDLVINLSYYEKISFYTKQFD
jgi:hypothetical protein